MFVCFYNKKNMPEDVCKRMCVSIVNTRGGGWIVRVISSRVGPWLCVSE